MTEFGAEVMSEKKSVIFKLTMFCASLPSAVKNLESVTGPPLTPSIPAKHKSQNCMFRIKAQADQIALATAKDVNTLNADITSLHTRDANEVQSRA